MTAHMRTSNQIIRKPPYRNLPSVRLDGGAITGGTLAITRDDPNTLNTNKPRWTDGHGVVGKMHLVSIALPTIATDPTTITAWIWCDNLTKWVKLGAGSTQNSKAFNSDTVDGFSAPADAIFYLQGSATIISASVDANPIPTVP